MPKTIIMIKRTEFYFNIFIYLIMINDNYDHLFGILFYLILTITANLTGLPVERGLCY